MTNRLERDMGEKKSFGARSYGRSGGVEEELRRAEFRDELSDRAYAPELNSVLRAPFHVLELEISEAEGFVLIDHAAQLATDSRSL